MSSTQIYEPSQAISERLSWKGTILGTWSHHKFVPTSDGFKMFKLSADQLSIIISREKSTTEINNSDLKPGQYAAVVFDIMVCSVY